MPSDAAPDFGHDAEAGRWNYRPPAPVQNNPLFDWPPRPMAVLRWYSAYWLVLSTTTLCLGLAILAWALWLPSLAETATLRPGWVMRVWLGFLIPQILLAGGLHYWLLQRNRQGRDLKYDLRDQARSNGTYTFRDQVRDNMFWTLASGITCVTLFTAAWFWAAGSGVSPSTTFARHPVWFLVLLGLIPLWGSLHFYWVHRALHWPPLYRLAHALHHRNVNVGPWSGISMHPVEHLIYFSSFLIFFVIPAHPIHVLFHAYLYTLHPVCSHSGFDALATNGRRRAELGDFFHQLHHRYFECNYGTVEMPWDRWFGTFHDGSASATQQTKTRKKRMHS
jgi:sterol desaturase/sphingolipid hydroxylase (fatty acid hydroxylase superfamily)